jgi:hypothetical protein
LNWTPSIWRVRKELERGRRKGAGERKEEEGSSRGEGEGETDGKCECGWGTSGKEEWGPAQQMRDRIEEGEGKEEAYRDFEIKGGEEDVPQPEAGFL